MIVSAGAVRAFAQVATDAGGPATLPAYLDANHKANLNFQNAPIGIVLNYLSTEFGFIVIPEVAISGRVSIVASGPVTADMALVMLNTALRVDGYAAVRQGDRILKIMNVDPLKRPAVIPMHFGIDPATIANTDAVITQVMVIQDDLAVRFWRDVKFVCANDPKADFTTSPAGRSGLIITDKSSEIRHIADLIQDFIGPHGKTLLDLAERRQKELAGK